MARYRPQRHWFCFQQQCVCPSRRCVCYLQRSRYHRLSSPAAADRTGEHTRKANNHRSCFRDGRGPRLSRNNMFTVRGAKLGRHDTAEAARSSSGGSECATWQDVTWLSRGLNDAAFMVCLYLAEAERIKKNRCCKINKCRQNPFW